MTDNCSKVLAHVNRDDNLFLLHRYIIISESLDSVFKIIFFTCSLFNDFLVLKHVTMLFDNFKMKYAIAMEIPVQKKTTLDTLFNEEGQP